MTVSADVDTAIQAVVPAAAAGDRHALQELINLIYPAILRYCRARVIGYRYPTAEDVAQEVCLAIARAMPTFEEKGLPFMAFAYRIASNKVVDARRVHSRDMSQPTDEMPDEEISPDTPESELLSLDSCNEVALLLDDLNERSREIITLRVFGGYSAEETAQMLGLTSGAVRVAQHRALAKLRELVEETRRRATG
ncbi:RNA polymerase sigma factor ShbA [Corynebacterium falsenii]|uniref:RNA polymerase sigma factor ShbA n=1 Tax=Corynebacterium falsenii TaxID=108486 RepID=UPI001CC91AB2|nr:RNA polymerase sigma factor ShbA [Corynebacterium falsenii]UBI07427.1 RNA polymerase sigma factor ShbA [Corynebacterium falsenii]